MTFENATVAQIGKKIQIEMTAKEFFCTEIDENEIQNCKYLEQKT